MPSSSTSLRKRKKRSLYYDSDSSEGEDMVQIALRLQKQKQQREAQQLQQSDAGEEEKKKDPSQVVPEGKRVKPNSNKTKNDNFTNLKTKQPKQQSSLTSFFSSSPPKATPSHAKASAATAAVEKSKEPKTQKSNANIHSFFSSSRNHKNKPPSSVAAVDSKEGEYTKENDASTTSYNNTKSDNTSNGAETAAAATAATETESSSNPSPTAPPSPPPFAPILPTCVDEPRNVRWLSLYDQHVIVRKVANQSPRTKVAALDLDGTLLEWTISGWPSQLHHYELWNTQVISKLRRLYDDEDYALIVVSNQGGVQKAHAGKKASLIKTVLNWLAAQIDRPLHAVMSTRTLKKCPTTSFHKPTAKMWNVMCKNLNKGQMFDVTKSFFVGDSDDDPDDPQGGVDRKFAIAVSAKYGNEGEDLKFYTPAEFFGPSHAARRLSGGGSGTSAPPPNRALRARAALLGGYLLLENGPILLLVCGVPGAGKTTFCDRLLAAAQKQQQQQDLPNVGDNNNNPHHWVHVSQDTINNGKPGKRENVEEKALAALRQGHSVVVDRTHLTIEQRAHFIAVAQKASEENNVAPASAKHVPVHCVFLSADQKTVARRVRHRTLHPGGVEGEKGVVVALRAMKSHIHWPAYDKEPGLQLILRTSSQEGADKLAERYGNLATTAVNTSTIDNVFATDVCLNVANGKDNDEAQAMVKMPAVALGTMGLGKRVTDAVVTSAINAGFRAVDTALSYQNEGRVGNAIGNIHDSNSSLKADEEVGQKQEQNPNQSTFCIAKVPKRATTSQQVREELDNILINLQRGYVDLLLLHWPCDVMALGTLEAVWKEMEACWEEGKCRALGVCNFNVAALTALLPFVDRCPIAVNQVERHPLLPQWELLDFCSNHDIVVQAHTPLVQGRPELLQHNDAAVAKVSSSSDQTPAQVLLRWNLQHGVPVVPKCSSAAHQHEALATKPLTPLSMKALDAISDRSSSSNGVGSSSSSPPPKQRRFVTPPFMYGSAAYCWGKRMPPIK